MITPRKTQVIPRITQVIPRITQQKQGFCYRNKGFCYRNSSTGRGEQKSTEPPTRTSHRDYPVEKNPFIQKTRSTRQRGERSDPPELISRKQEEHRHRTKTPQHTKNLKNETFGIKRVFATEKRGGDVRDERARLFEPPPHDQNRHPQRHTVQGYYFFTFSQVTRGV